MRSLLTALQEGRLIELPDSDKNKALEYLAAIIEAIPDINPEDGVTESVLAREKSHNTGIGKGWGCPHMRSPRDGEILCAVGWSPKGIDYGAPDNEPVHIIVMYYVPDGQKNAYLKEISSLAKAIMTQKDLQELKTLAELSDVRHRLLDAITIALESTAPEARARMIQIEARQAAATEAAAPALPADFTKQILSLQIVIIPGQRPIVLSQDRELVTALESKEQLGTDLNQLNHVEHQGFRVFTRSSTTFQPDRIFYDCIAIKVT